MSSASVVLLSELFPPLVGGSAVLFQETYSRLSNRRVVVLTDKIRSPSEVVREGSMEIVRGDLANSHWGVLHPSGLRKHLHLAKLLRSIAIDRPSVVHCGRTLPEGLAAAICSLSGGPKFCCWVHGEDLTMQLSTSRELRYLTKWVCRRSTGFFVNSHFTAGLVRELGVPERRIQVIHPGVDPARFHPGVDGSRIRDRYAPNGEPLILSIGRLQRRKGFDLAISAVAELRNELPTLRYVIVGEGQDREYLEGLISRHHLSGRVSAVGRIPDEELPEYYAACDIFVHPNRVEDVDVEGFGIVFLEAAASARPSIGGRSGGVPEAVADGETGCLVSGTDSTELAGVLLSLLSSPERAQDLGRRGRNRVLRDFSWDRVSDRLESAIQEMEP